jgi:hypothetical protein
MKAQYFSFDAIVAAVIMVMAFSAFLTYWYSLQFVTDSRTNNLQIDAMRVAESLFSPGDPEEWAESSSTIDAVSQFGLANGFSNELNLTKIKKLDYWGDIQLSSNYEKIGSILHVSGYNMQYYLLIQPVNGSKKYTYQIGAIPSSSANEVAIANRGAVLVDDRTGERIPVRMQVQVWRGDKSSAPVIAFCDANSKIGDPNGDDRIDLADAAIINKIYSDSKLMPANKCCVDINNDGIVDPRDSLLINRYIVGIKGNPYIDLPCSARP